MYSYIFTGIDRMFYVQVRIYIALKIICYYSLFKNDLARIENEKKVSFLQFSELQHLNKDSNSAR